MLIILISNFTINVNGKCLVDIDTCTESCETGSQVFSRECEDADGNTVDNSECEAAGGSATETRDCNTFDCPGDVNI